MSVGPVLNLDFIHPQLAVGGRYPMEAATHLAEVLGIRAVVDVRSECCDDAEVLRASGLELLHLPTVDMKAVSQDVLDLGVQWVSGHLDREHKVLIHCEHGAGRSVLLALCVLVSRGQAPLEALSRAKGARWKVSPSVVQLTAFVTWCTRHREALGRDYALPTLHELGEIAYRNVAESDG